jgi:hypothetical protein
LISGENIVAADKQSTSQDLLADLEKGVRRGKKLEKTLLKIITQSEPGSDVESLLKSVQQGLKTLKKEAKKVQQHPAIDTKKVAAQRKPTAVSKTQSEKTQLPIRRSRKKGPAAADASSVKDVLIPEAGE